LKRSDSVPEDDNSAANINIKGNVQGNIVIGNNNRVQS
jgi:hypothetical protein